MGGVAWTDEEDNLLRKCIEQYGEGKWHRVPLLAGLNRCRKSCRLRWLNYLRPNINRGRFSDEEKELIIKLHKLLGNRWSIIAGRLPGRTANDVKNFWNCRLCKKINNNDHAESGSEQTSKATVPEELAAVTGPWQQQSLAKGSSDDVLQLSDIDITKVVLPYNITHDQQLPLDHHEGSSTSTKQSTTLLSNEPCTEFDHLKLIGVKDEKLYAGEGAGGEAPGSLMMKELPVDFDFEELRMMSDPQNNWDLDDLIVNMDPWSCPF